MFKSKASIKDTAELLPTKLKKLEEELNEIFNNAKKLPSGLEFLNTIKKMREKTPGDETEGKKIVSDIHDKENELWYQCAELLPQLEKGLEKLQKLAEGKLQLKEEARLRKAMQNYTFVDSLRQLEQPQIEFSSAWLQKLLNNVLETREETKKICQGLANFMESTGLKEEQKTEEKKFTL